MSNERTEIGDLGEFGLIDFLTKNIEIKNAGTVVGVGDDAAVVDAFGQQTVVTTDLLVEGVHFDMAYTPLKHLGYKAVVVNLSDVYAMNAQPQQILMSIAVSNRFSVEALNELYEGIYLACKFYGVDLIGGDTTSSTSGLVINGTALGTVSQDAYVQRSTAKKGDLLCVTGDLGAAYIGLQLLEREKRIFMENPGVQPDLGKETYPLERILKPEARRDIVQFFADQKIKPTAMMDVSDGLSSDVQHICEKSSLGCVIYEEKLPIHEDTKKVALQLNIDYTTCALQGGEDYELLFTLSQDDYDKITLSEQISVIGHMTEAVEGLQLITTGNNKHPLQSLGWDALKKKNN